MWINLGYDNHISKVAWGMGSIYNLIAMIFNNHNLVTCAHVIITPFKSKEVSNYVALTLANDELPKLVKRNPNTHLKNGYSYIFQAPLIGKFNILIIELKKCPIYNKLQIFYIKKWIIGCGLQICSFHENLILNLTTNTLLS